MYGRERYDVIDEEMRSYNMDNNKALLESDSSEWKWSWCNEYLKWIAAFANTDGGTPHIGVNDDGYVVGLKDHRKLLESIPNAIRDKLHIYSILTSCPKKSRKSYLLRN